MNRKAIDRLIVAPAIILNVRIRFRIVRQYHIIYVLHVLKNKIQKIQKPDIYAAKGEYEALKMSLQK